MASQKSPRKKRAHQRGTTPRGDEPAEGRTSETVTVGWTVTLTTLFFSNLAAILAHLYVVSFPPAHRMAMLRELLLYAGLLVGILSLVLLPVVYRVRSTPPPRGLVAFGVCLAAAPILAVLLRSLS